MAETNMSKRSLSTDRDGSSPARRKAKLDSNDAGGGGLVPTLKLKYGTQLYHCRYCDMFALLKEKLASHKREIHNKKQPKQKTGTTRTRGLNSTINQGAGSESVQGAASENGQGAPSSGEVGKADNVELTCDSEDSMDYDLTDDDKCHYPDDDYEDHGPHDELYGPVF